MKVKLLKKIRKRFSVVPEGICRYNIFDDKTAIEENIFGNKITDLLMYICCCLDTPFFKYSLWYKDKLRKRKNKALRRKYFPFRKN